MNRRGFLGRIGLALAGVALAPAVNLLAVPETPCHQGILWQIEHSKPVYYTGEFTMADLKEVIRALENQWGQDR